MLSNADGLRGLFGKGILRTPYEGSDRKVAISPECHQAGAEATETATATFDRKALRLALP